MHRPAAVARPGDRRQRRAPGRHRRRAAEAGAHGHAAAASTAIRPSASTSSRNATPTWSRCPATRWTRSRRIRKEPELSGIAGQHHRQPGRERHQLAARAGRGRRHRPGAVDRGAVLLPAPLAVDADGDAGDPDLLRDDAGLHVLHRRHAQHPVDDGPAAGGRHAGRQRRGRGGEHLPGTREACPTSRVLASILGTRHVAIALSAGTLCHCIVFLPNLFGERNFLSIYLSQIAITISVSLLASWLVAVSLIPMISARMKTPPAVRRDDGLIPRLQRRYARPAALDAGASRQERPGHPADHRRQHRADDADQDEHVRRRRRRRSRALLPVEGRLHQGADVGRGPAHREVPRRQPQAATTSTRSTPATASRAGAAPASPSTWTRSTTPSRWSRRSARSCPSRRAPASASATRAVRRRRRAGSERAGAPGRRFDRRRWPNWPTTSCRSWRRRKELRDVRVDTGDQNSELAVQRRSRACGVVRLQRAAGGAASSAWRCAARRCASSAAARPRCRCGCASPAPSSSASRTSPASRCAHRTAGRCRCWRWSR